MNTTEKRPIAGSGSTIASNLHSDIATSNWLTSLSSRADVGSSLNALMASLQQRQALVSEVSPETRSAFTATSSSLNVTANSDTETSNTSGAPPIKRVRRMNHSQRNFSPANSAQSQAGPSISETSGSSKLNNTSAVNNLESLLQLQRLYQTNLLSNFLMSNPELVLRMQQLNALQQALQAQSALSLQSNIFTGGVNVADVAAAAQSITAGAQSGSFSRPAVVNQQPQQAGNFGAALSSNPLLAAAGQQIPSLSPLLGSLLQQMQANANAQPQLPLVSKIDVPDVARPTAELPPVVATTTTNDTLMNSNTAAATPTTPTAAADMNFYNLLLQQQYAAAAAALAVGQQPTVQPTVNVTSNDSSGVLPVVVNGQENNAPSVRSPKFSSVKVENATVNGSAGKKVQQIPVCRRALEARFARILAQELEASDDEHELRVRSKSMSCAAAARNLRPTEMERRGSDASQLLALVKREHGAKHEESTITHHIPHSTQSSTISTSVSSANTAVEEGNDRQLSPEGDSDPSSPSTTKLPQRPLSAAHHLKQSPATVMTQSS